MNPTLRRQVKELSRRIQMEPEYFVEEILGDELVDYQREILQSIRDNALTTVRSHHDSGKSFTAARAALWFLEAHPQSIVLTTAPTFRQVEQIIWREIRNAHRKSKIPLGGKLLNTMLDLSDDWYAIGVSSDDPDKVQGFHPKSGFILVVVDEAAGVAEDIFVAIDAVLSSEGARALYIGNPTSLAGRFYTSHHSDPSSSKIHISPFKTPNFLNNGIENLEDLMEVDLSTVEIVAPYLITPAWAKNKITLWGVESPMFQARVLGEFPSAEENTLIPLNYIEAAATKERFDRLDPGDPFVGVDVARYGNDKTVISYRHGPIVEKQIVHGKENTTTTAGRVKLLLNDLGTWLGVYIDSDGVGGGVADILTDDKIEEVVEIYNNSKAFPERGGLKFVNLRSQIYWHLAELFRKGLIYIPPNSELMSQLASIRYYITRNGIEVEKKDDIVKRLKISPDRADSLAYCFADFLNQAGNPAAPSVGKSVDELYNEEQRR